MRVSTLLLLLLVASFAQAGKPEMLFNGTNLEGWEGDNKVFRVEDGAIVGGSLATGLKANSFLATTREFGDFELTLTFKIAGDPVHANSGVQIRSQRIPNDHEMIGYQADIGQHYWGCLYDESRRNKVLAQPDEATRKRAVKQDDWNTYRIRCEGRRVQLWLNEIQTVDYTEPDEALVQRGRIALQVHSGPPVEIRFKDIALKDLSPTK